VATGTQQQNQKIVEQSLSRDYYIGQVCYFSALPADLYVFALSAIRCSYCALPGQNFLSYNIGALNSMRQNISSLLMATLLLIALQATGGDINDEIDLIGKSIESTNGTVSDTKMDAESARRILAHFGSPKDRWEHFLRKIRKGEKGVIVTALYIVEFATNETQQQELIFTLQETLIVIPEIVLAANQTANSSLKWACGKPAYNNYDLAEHLVDERITALTEMLAAMDSKDKRIKLLYSGDLRPLAATCLAMVRATASRQSNNDQLNKK
jgi:hypothetical protein